jgi:hypothetical protein
MGTLEIQESRDGEKVGTSQTRDACWAVTRLSLTHRGDGEDTEGRLGHDGGLARGEGGGGARAELHLQE